MVRFDAWIALGIIALIVAVTVAPLITVLDQDLSETSDFQENEVKNVTDRLDANVTQIDTGADTATVTMMNTLELNSSTKNLNVSESKDFVLNNETVNVTLVRVSGTGSNVEARLTIVHSPFFGFQYGTQTLWDNTEILLAVLGFVMVFAAVIKVSNL